MGAHAARKLYAVQLVSLHVWGITGTLHLIVVGVSAAGVGITLGVARTQVIHMHHTVAGGAKLGGMSGWSWESVQERVG